MADDKVFTIAGTSTHNGESTYRFATGKAKVREGVLRRNGHTDIALFDLPSEMTKSDAIVFLNTKKGVKAKIPISGRKPAVVLTPEQTATNDADVKRLAVNEARRMKRANAKLETLAVTDAAFIAGPETDNEASVDAETLIATPPDVEQLTEAANIDEKIDELEPVAA